MTDRIQKLIPCFQASGMDALLVTDDVNVGYLTRFPAQESWLLVTTRSAFYITDSRYIEEAKVGLAGTEVRVLLFQDSRISSMWQTARRAKVGVLGLDEGRLTVTEYRRIKAAAVSGERLKNAAGVVDRLRMIKEPGEISVMKEALRINLEAFRFLARRARPGRSEAELMSDLESFIRRRKVGFSFPPIIASGPNSAMPHARVSERKLVENEPLMIDCGVDVRGYKSDLTRMFFLGKMPPSYAKVLSHVKEAQLTAIARIKPGVRAAEVDAAARACLKRYGLDRYFGHGLGHGVGLNIHELPGISRKSQEILLENMVFTVEPGVYFPGRYGIRLEEMVRVTERGCEVLSTSL